MLSPRLCIFIGFILRFAVAIWNGYFGPSIGAEFDAQSFHFLASEIAQNASFTHFQITWIYSQLLGIFYLLTTDSLFLGSLLSCFAWTLSACFLIGSMNLLLVSQVDQIKAMLIYALLPTSILFTAITLREPYQLLFVNLQIYAVLKICFRSTISNWAMLIFACIGAGFLHGGLIAFGILLLIIVIFFQRTNKFKNISLPKLLIYGAIVLVGMYYIFMVTGELTTYKIDMGIGAAIESFNEKASSLEARTNYKSVIIISNIWDLGFFIATSTLGYLFEPFFWHVQNLGDLVLAFESILRGYLIYRACRAWQITYYPYRQIIFLIFFLYLILTIIFAVGTVNWGTAARHNLLALGLLLLASFGASRDRCAKNSPPKIGSKNLGMVSE
jgi:hypothetical protein